MASAVGNGAGSRPALRQKGGNAPQGLMKSKVRDSSKKVRSLIIGDPPVANSGDSTKLDERLLATRLTTDSRGFDTTSGGKLVTVSRSGLVKVLWAPATLTVSEGVASPDAKHIAINVNSQQSNVWMLTGF